MPDVVNYVVSIVTMDSLSTSSSGCRRRHDGALSALPIFSPASVVYGDVIKGALYSRDTATVFLPSSASTATVSGHFSAFLLPGVH